MVSVLNITRVIIAMQFCGILFIPLSATTAAFDFKHQRRLKLRGRKNIDNPIEVVKLNKRVGERMVDKCARRVFDGNRANSRDLPYQVTIRKEFDNGRQWWSVCGGAIITGFHVITVAHCFADVLEPRRNGNLSHYKVIAGTTRSNILLYGDMEQRRSLLRELEKHLGTWMTIAACHKHLLYRTDVEDINNIAILQLKKAFVFSETIKPIRMITDDTFYSVKLTPGSLCLVSGYGAYEMFTVSTFLKMACIPIVDFNRCKNTFYRKLKSNITQVCAGSTVSVGRTLKKNTCTGDAGGPLVCQGLLVGVVSYVQGNCYSIPGVYTLLSGYTIAPYSPFQLVEASSSATTSVFAKKNYYIVPLLTIICCNYICADISLRFTQNEREVKGVILE